MGAWGFESCSSDGCWDALSTIGIDEIHEMDQADIDKACEKLANCIKNNVGPEGYEMQDYDKVDIIGCIIWFLRHGFKVSKDLLEVAVPFANEMKKNNDYDCWSDPAERKKEFERECDQMAQAFEGDGTIPEEHIPGLFENLAKKLGI